MKEELLKTEKEYLMDWDAYADTIVARKYGHEWDILRKARTTHYKELFDLRPGMKVLDAGCGHGEYTLFALEDGCRVDAFDFARRMVDHTRILLNSRNQTPDKLYVGNVLEIDEPDNSYDAVICLVVLDHVGDRNRALSEMRRVLKPGGHLYLDVPNRTAFPWRTGIAVMQLLNRYPEGRIHFFSRLELKRILTKNGYEIEKTLGMTFIPPLSGIYTSDIRRFTIFPKPLISILDKIYLNIETFARKNPILKPLCLHDFLKCRKV